MSCQCKWCLEISPKLKSIKAKLDGEDAKFFEEFIGMYLTECEDRDCSEAKLDGSWPGWEWIAEEKKRRFGE